MIGALLAKNKIGGEENKSPLTIIDTREKNPYPIENSISSKLDTGDYSLCGFEQIIAVDRKASVAELAHNLIEPRFKAELERLSKIPHSYLLLEFSLEDIVRYPIGSDIPKKKWRYIKIKAPFILAALSRITLKYGVHVIYAGNRENARYLLNLLFKHFLEIQKMV